jgi:hypothetical protein
MTNISGFNTALQNLSTNPNQLRIRKLLWVICYQEWENDTQRLQAHAMANLLQDLQIVYPHLEDVQNALYQVAQSLNKSLEYQRLADFIVGQLQVMYDYVDEGYVDETAISQPKPSQPEPTPVFSATAPPAQASAATLGEVTQAVLWHEKGLQMQQLLLLVGYNQWETDPEQLAQLDTQGLIQAVHQLSPNFDQLQDNLITKVHDAANQIDNEIDNEMDYIWAADALSELMWKLYGPTSPSTHPPWLSNLWLSNSWPNHP